MQNLILYRLILILSIGHTCRERTYLISVAFWRVCPAGGMWLIWCRISFFIEWYITHLPDIPMKNIKKIVSSSFIYIHVSWSNLEERVFSLHRYVRYINLASVDRELNTLSNPSHPICRTYLWKIGKRFLFVGHRHM